MPEQYYTVIWEIQVTAENPFQAAQCALDDYRDRTLAKPILDIIDEKGRRVRINMNNRDDRGVEITEKGEPCSKA